MELFYNSTFNENKIVCIHWYRAGMEIRLKHREIRGKSPFRLFGGGANWQLV